MRRDMASISVEPGELKGFKKMDRNYSCYCGLYCGNCAVKVRIEPAAKVLYEEMKNADFDDVVGFIPGGSVFWSFLKDMAEDGICVSCRDGSGNPGCTVRVCAKEKSVEMCVFCDAYPCDKFEAFFSRYPMLVSDNDLLRDKGWDAWAKLQDERRSRGYTYSNERKE